MKHRAAKELIQVSPSPAEEQTHKRNLIKERELTGKTSILIWTDVTNYAWPPTNNQSNLKKHLCLSKKFHLN